MSSGRERPLNASAGEYLCKQRGKLKQTEVAGRYRSVRSDAFQTGAVMCMCVVVVLLCTNLYDYIGFFLYRLLDCPKGNLRPVRG